MFFVGMSEKTYPGSHDWLINACREAGFTPRILQDADREPAVISFVAAGLRSCSASGTDQKTPARSGHFPCLCGGRPSADAWAIWKVNNSSDCLKQYIQIVKELS